MRDRAKPNDGEVSVSGSPVSSGGPVPKRHIRAKLVALAAIVAVAMLAWLGPKAWLIVGQQGKTISVPDAVGALIRQNIGSASVLAEVLRQQGVRNPIVAAYADAEQRLAEPGATRISLYFAAGSGLIWQPEALLDELLAVLADAATMGYVYLREASLDSAGGFAKCATLNSGPNPGYFVCGRADHGAIAFILIDRGPLGFDTGIELMHQFWAAAVTETP